ncbi:MAG: hypothetical protein ACMUIP_07745 [bacterium]
MVSNKECKALLILCAIILIGIVHYSSCAQAQNWVELPPYNTLWPLWSPALSPVDSVTGLPTPIVSSLTPDVELPVMPGLTWDPSLPYPWLLYNTYSGMAYFDPLSGIDLWPAPSLRDNAGAPLPISLPTDYANLPPVDLVWLVDNLFVANNAFLFGYKAFSPLLGATSTLTAVPSITDLLTPIDILGPALALPSALAPPPPPPPIPTQTFSALVVPVIPPPVSTVVAEQAGIWDGTWFSLLKTTAGPMKLDLVENPATGLSGTAFLVDNKLIPVPVDVTGLTPVSDFFTLEGSYFNITNGVTYTLELQCTLISESHMSGTYYISKVGALKDDYGEFNLTLITPVITIPAPIVAPVPPAVTPVVPLVTGTVPVPTAPIPIAPVTVPVPTVVAPVPATSTVPVVTVGTTAVPVVPVVSGLFWY